MTAVMNQTPTREFSRIHGVGSFRPDVIVTNDDVCQWIDSSDEWIQLLICMTKAISYQVSSYH